MKVSKYTYTFPLDEKFVVLNSLTQALSIISKPYYDIIQEMKAGLVVGDDDGHPLVDELYEQGFMVPDSTSERAFVQLQMTQLRPLMSAQLRQEIVIIPTFSCNLTCSYCFQHAGRHSLRPDLPVSDHASRNVMSKEMVDAAFGAVDAFPNNFAGRVMTIFGGEPLMNTIRAKEVNDYICSKARKLGWGLRIYTNGIELGNHIDLIRAHRPNFQVTFHDICNKGSDFREVAIFRKWVAGIRAASMEKAYVTIRINVSSADVDQMPNVCRRFAQVGLFDLPYINVYFTPVLNKNFSDADFNQQAMHILSRLLELRESNSEMLVADFIGWKVLDYFKAMAGNHDVPVPKFVRCPAMENLLCFDISGQIYPCYELAGFSEYAIGSFYPNIEINANRYKLWQSRTILHDKAKQCGACPTSTICGGGCAAESLRRESNIHAASCEASESDLKYFIENHPDIVRRAISGMPLFSKTM